DVAEDDTDGGEDEAGLQRGGRSLIVGMHGAMLTDLESVLVVSEERSLLYLEEDRVLEQPEAVAGGEEQDHVAGPELAGRDALEIVGVDVELAAAAAHDDALGRADDAPLDLAVDVARDGGAGRVDDEAELQGRVAGGDEGGLLGRDVAPDDEGERLPVVRDGLDAGHGTTFTAGPAAAARRSARRGWRSRRTLATARRYFLPRRQ